MNSFERIAKQTIIHSLKNKKMTIFSRSSNFFAILFLSVLVGASCSPTKKTTSPYEKAIKQWKFTPFNLFRDGDGVGTLITFEKGRESVVFSKKSCLNALEITTFNSVVPKFSFEINRNNTTDLGVSEEILSKVGVPANLKAVVNIGTIKKIIIEFDSTFETRLERGVVNQLLDDMTSAKYRNDSTIKSCFNGIVQKDNFLIERILGAKKIRYSFVGENEQNITINSELLKQINLDNSYANKFIGKASIELDKPIMIGYRVWRVKPSRGIGDTKVEISDVEMSEITKLKRASSKKK